MFRRRSRSEPVDPDALDDHVDDGAEDDSDAEGPVQGPWDADDLDDDGIAIVLDATAADDEKIVLAAQGCPTQAITVFDGDNQLV